MTQTGIAMSLLARYTPTAVQCLSIRSLRCAMSKPGLR
jgi:hypothetical protein